MGRLCKLLVVVCLLLTVSALPTTPSLAQQYVDLDAGQAVQTVNGLIGRLNAEAGRVRAHRIPPGPYYDEPCTPTKSDAERTLSAFRAQRRAFVAEIEALKARILVLEGFSSSAIVLSNNGWKVHDINRFRSLDQALRALDQAIAAKEAEIDAVKVLPCRTTATPPTTPQPKIGPTTPLTPAEEGQFEDFPLPQPVFDDPVTMPTPPRFCTYAERKAWMDSVYWPTIRRAQSNALKAIETYQKAEARLREVRASDRPDSPRIALAERAVRAWEKIKNDRMAEHQRLLAIDVPNPVDCGRPSTTGGTAVTPPQPPVTPPAPATDGPGVAPPPLPPGVNRPQLERVTVPTLPRRFCSEREKQAFLVDVYHPAAEAASKNALKASEYRKRLADLVYEATVARNEPTLTALKAEYEAWKPIAEEADRLQTRMMRMRDEILRIPVVDCSKPEDPKTSPPPVDDSGLEPVIVTGGPIREPGGQPGLPRPDLARPQFERVRDIQLPARFCSAYERNDFLNNVYNPAVAAALANARTAQAHQARLNALFTQYMKANSPYWSDVRAERDAFEAITNEALNKSGALNDLYLKIMAIPIVDCGPRSEPPPTTTPQPPVTTPGGAVAPPPTDGPTGGTDELGGVKFPEIRLPAMPGEWCQGEEQRYEGEADQAMRTVEENEQRIREYRRELEEEIRYYTGHPDRKLADQARSRLEALKDIEARVARDRAAVEAFREAMKKVGRDCPPPSEDAPGVTPPKAPAAQYFELPAPPRDPCDKEARAAYREQLLDLYDRIDDAAEALDAWLYPGDLVRFPIGPERAEAKARLEAYEELLDYLEDRLDDLAFGQLRYIQLCPPPAEKKEDCPPKEGRDPINVGPNGKVGSGAQLKSKLGGMATGALLGALGVGGGGGSDGPDLWQCKIKDGEYTVFDDPATGVSLKVAAKRAKGGQVVIFSEIARSPDKGTFQTAFLQRPTGETLGPKDIGPCDLWGEWKLTVSWTKSTYVDGALVSRESGGWSETGLFKIPGVLSKVDAPDGFWKRMGFSSATAGAREMGMIYDLPAGGGPLTLVIHVTRPKGDPVTTVPFVLTMTEGPNGFTFTKAEDEPCPEEEMVDEDDPERPGPTIEPGAGFFYIPGTDVVLKLAPDSPYLTQPRPAGTTPPPASDGLTERQEAGAREVLAAWEADDATLFTAVKDGKACDPTIRDRWQELLAQRREMYESAIDPAYYNPGIIRAWELYAPRLAQIQELLGDGKPCETPLPPREGGALPPPPPPMYVEDVVMTQYLADDVRRQVRELIDQADAQPCPDGYKRALDRVRRAIDDFRRMSPRGNGADVLRGIIDDTLTRLRQMEDEILRKMNEKCPAPSSVFKTEEADAPTPRPYTPPIGGGSGPRLPYNPPPDRPISEPAKVDTLVADARKADSGLAQILRDAARACPTDPAKSWTALRNRARAILVARMLFLSSVRPMGPGTEHMTDAVRREFERTQALLEEVNALQPPTCEELAPDKEPSQDEVDSILDDIEEKLVIG